MDHLELSSAQLDTLSHAAGGTLDFNAGTSLTVVGTSFLHSGSNLAAVAHLVGQADVTVKLDGSDVAHLVHGSDAQLDALVSQLSQAGMDHLELSSAQLDTLAHAHSGGDALSFNAGTDLTVVGTSFLHSGTNVADVAGLVDQADVTVKLDDTDVARLVAGSDAELDALVEQLTSAGMDRLELGAGQALALAGNADLTFNAGTEIVVDGANALGGAAGVAAAEHLFGQADLTVKLSDTDVADLVSPEAAAQFAQLALEAGVDHLAMDGTMSLDSSEALDLALALDGLSLASGQSVVLTDGQALFSQLLHGDELSAASLSALHDLAGSADVSMLFGMGDVAQLPTDQAALANVLHTFETEMGQAGVDQFVLSDDLAAALAKSDVSFLDPRTANVPLPEIEVLATADNSDGTAYLHSTLQDLQQLGVEKVVLDSDVTEMAVALHGAGFMVSPDLRLEDMPSFQHAGNQSVSLVLDAADLAALMNAPDAFNALHSGGFTELRLTDEVSDGAMTVLQSALHDSGLHWSSAPLSSTEVELLGLSTDMDQNPADPFHLHPTKS